MAITLNNTITALLADKKYKTVKDILLATNEADIAAVFDDLPKNDIPILFRLMPKDLAADTFALMDADTQEILVKGFSDSELKEVIDELYLDDMADMIDEMPANVVSRILANTDPEKRSQINEILKYPEDSAGSLMTIEYIILRPKMTVSEAIKRIKRTVSDKEMIYTCYVTDNDRRLIGYIPVKNLLIAELDDIIEDIMETTTVYVYTHEDKEDVAKKMGKYDFAIMPVVDEEMRLVGIITFDDAIDVMQEETTEDLEIMAAIAPTDDDYFKTSDIKHAKNRIVWLLILMLSSAITGSILSYYEDAFSAIPILVSFIPMLMGTGGNCGSQSSTMVIRSMAIDDIRLSDYLKVLWTELRVSLLLSVSLALVNGIRIFIMYNHDIKLATVISLSIIGIVVMSQVIGCSLPMLAKRLKLDPAVMAAPLITTIVDAGSVMIYFTIAMRFFKLV